LDGEIKKPNDVLTELDKRIKKALKQENEINESRDGMDIALCSIHKTKSILHYAGANRPLVIVRDGKLIEITPTKLPIGGHHKENKVFEYHEVELQKGDCVYLFTDGYCDQFGGPNGKKFMKKNFYELLVKINAENMQSQKKLISKSINDWKGKTEQTDDMLVIGIKYI
jgi:serine phosphatase RsbU (regulator of sigma subunit)